MRLAQYRGEQTIAAVVTRLFPSAGADDAAAVEKTLLRTNPHLRNLGTLQSGAPIVLSDDLPASAEAVAIDRGFAIENRIKPASNEPLRGAVTAPAASRAASATVPASSHASSATTAAPKATSKSRKVRKPKPRK